MAWGDDEVRTGLPRVRRDPDAGSRPRWTMTVRVGWTVGRASPLHAPRAARTLPRHAGTRRFHRGDIMDVVDRLRDASILDLDGNEVRLGELWAERTVVLVFVRHYG